MFQAPRSRPVPVGLLVPPRPSSAPPGGSPDSVDRSRRPAGRTGRSATTWPWTAVGLAALYPLFLASAGLVAIGLRPVPQTVTETAYRPPAPTSEPTDVSETIEVPETDLPASPVEPGQARPRSMISPVGASDSAPAVAAVPDPGLADAARPPRCDRFGTAIDFVRSPSVACRQAAREQKLVMVLHLAGNFDDPGFT